MYHFIMVIISIGDIFMSIAIPFDLDFLQLGNFGSAIAHLSGYFSPGP